MVMGYSVGIHLRY
uniref:Uncharacterized protein n=1 Tax=Arundo donax TaxID=35708 RepID=A0A0A9CAE1_ARUDO